MSTPAIVLMTDPSRCSLGDVHYLVQALLEMQQMGGQATPQAFCDHPAAARDFVDAYTHAYPKLVLDDEEIPSPDHLHSLITNGQIGAFARPQLPSNPVSFDGLARPAEQNGLNPVVVLTLGSSQLLIDALRQSPGVKESIRLIDIAPDEADTPPVSIADAVAMRGLESETWDHDRPHADALELDDIAGPAAGDPTSLVPRHDPMNLDVVETADALTSTPPAYDRQAADAPATSASASAATATATAAQPESADTAAHQESAAATPAEPALDVASQADAAWQNDATTAPPAVTSVPVATTDVPAQQDAAAQTDSEDQTDSDDETGDGAGPETPPAKDATDDGGPGKQIAAGQDDEIGKSHGADDTGDLGQEIDTGDDDEGEKSHGADDEVDDVEYPPVGSLLAGADVLYPAQDQEGTHGMLQELAAAILDDGMIDPDMAFESLDLHRDDEAPPQSGDDAILTVHTGDGVVSFEDFYGSLDQADDDTLADSSHPPHVDDADL